MGKWEKKKLSEVAEIITGSTPRTKKSEYYLNGTIPFVKPPDLGSSEPIVDTITKVTKKALEVSRPIPENAILVCCIGSLGKFGIAGRNLITNQQINTIVFNQDIIIPKFGFYYAYTLEKKLNEIANKAIVQIVNKTNFSKIKISYPKELKEQRRIVAKLDALFAVIDRAIGLLEENIAHTQALMGSVLDEEFNNAETENIPLKKLSNNVQYGYTGKSKEKGEFYYLRITDIQNGKVDYNTTPFSDIPKDEVPKYLLKEGDILFARTGATAGKSYLFNDDEDAVFASYLIRVVAKREVLSPEYLKWFFQSDNYWAQIFGNIVGAAQPNFNGTKLKKLIIPVPKMNVQLILAEKFNVINEEIEQLIKGYNQKLNNLKSLKSSLLDQAFKGEL